MGLILVGILAGILVFGLTCLHVSRCKKEDMEDTLLFLLAFVCVIGGLIEGITEPVSGYGEPQMVSTTKLVSLREESVTEGKGCLFYISVSGTNSYTYYVEVDSPYISNSQKAYQSNTISSSNVTIVEDNSFEDAKLVTYVRYGKKTFWTFAVGAKQYEYVFYVPTGTIARNVSLG